MRNFRHQIRSFRHRSYLGRPGIDREAWSLLVQIASKLAPGPRPDLRGAGKGKVLLFREPNGSGGVAGRVIPEERLGDLLPYYSRVT